MPGALLNPSLANPFPCHCPQPGSSHPREMELERTPALPSGTGSIPGFAEAVLSPLPLMDSPTRGDLSAEHNFCAP